MGKLHSFAEVIVRAVNRVSWSGMLISSGVLFILMFYICADVISRYFFTAPLPGTLEISRLMLVAIVFLAIGLTQSKQMNVRIEFIVGRWAFRKQAILAILYAVVGIVIFGLMMKQGIAYAVSDYHYGVATDILHVPVFPAKLLIPIGAALMMLQLLIEAVGHIQRLVRGR